MAGADQGKSPDYVKLAPIQAALMRGTYAVDADAIANALAAALINALAQHGPCHAKR